MYNCSKLCEETLESFYWVGFIIADGCISKVNAKTNNLRLTIVLNNKDKCILERLVEYLENGKIQEKDNIVKIGYCKGVKEFKDKYNFNFRKTYNPLKFKDYQKYTKDQLLAILCGIIDGDGSITYKHKNKNVFIRIAAHKNWKEFYENFLTYLNIPFTINSYKDTSICICIENKDFIFNLYDKVTSFNLPLLTRKWNRIENISRNKDNWIPIQQFDLNNNFIAEYHSIQAASKITGIGTDSICKCCKGKIKKTHGYIFKYLSNDI